MCFISACDSQADLETIKKNFSENRESFSRLNIMILRDVTGLDCFAIGTDHIGVYWEYSDKWNTNQNYERKISLSQVLIETGLSEQRYKEYLSLFKKTDSERVEICPKEPNWVQILVHRSGLAVSGCSTTINIRGNGFVPTTTRKSGYFSEITKLGNGWYLNHECT